MADVQMINQLKFRIASLESNLTEKQKVIQEYRSIESQADSKIKGMTKIHNEKIKSLLNSIQILKKQKASVEGLSKQHKRSKLIEQLNKEILDQDLAIEMIRNYVYEKEGKQQGRKSLDEVIVNALKKGPERIRPLTREQLRIEIDKLKEININLQRKIKQGDFSKKRGVGGQLNQQDGDVSEISSVGSESFVNQNQEVLGKLRQFQLDNETLKLQVNSKVKIIEKLKTDIKEKDRLKAQVELLKNELEMASRRVLTFEKMLKDSKQNTNKKLIDLYERELKVQQLQLMSKDNSDQLKNAQNSHNIFLEELRVEKQQLQAKLQALQQQNEKTILENITHRKRQDQQKTKISQIREINTKQKTQLGEKLAEYERQVQRVLAENKKLTQAYQNIQGMLFKERGQWVQQRNKLLGELQANRQTKTNNQRYANFMIEIDNLKEENKRLKDIVEGGGSGQGGDDKLMMERLDNYRRKLEYLESQDPKKDSKIYNQMFQKHNQLIDEFAEYKRKGGKGALVGGQSAHRGKKRKQIVDLTRKQERKLDDMSSGISNLNLQDVDPDILDNFNSSYQYSIHINEFGERVRMPKVTEADKELLKLINSDLWYFVAEDNALTKKIDEASDFANEEPQIETDPYLQDKIRKIRNLSHPKGQRISLYQQEMGALQQMSDNVSITSAMDKEINKYDSDVNVQMKKAADGAPKDLNYGKLKNMNLDIGSDVDVSSVESGVSNLRKKTTKQVEKAGRIRMTTADNKPTTSGLNKVFDSDISLGESSFESSMMNSDVSSVNMQQNVLDRIDSDIQVDFRKKKTHTKK